MLVLALGITTLLLCIGAFTQPTPRWIFWAVCLVLIGFLFPFAWAGLALCLFLRGMGWLWRATQG